MIGKTKYNTLAFQYENVDSLIQSVKLLKGKNIKIDGIYSPFPLYQLDGILDTKTIIPAIGLIMGLIGAAFGFLFQYWANSYSYLLQFGGKPELPALSYIPVAFETAVLLSGVSMCFAFLYRSHLYPGNSTQPLSTELSDCKFMVVVIVSDQLFQEQIISLLNETNPEKKFSIQKGKKMMIL